MLIIDTSLWIQIYRDPSGTFAQRVRAVIGDEEYVFCQLIRSELLQGCRDEREWAQTLEYLDEQSYLEMSLAGWTDAARIYFELRQRGFTVRSTLDCCIAVVALQHDLMLLHNDRDFETIAMVRPLKHRRVEVAQSP